MASYPHKLLPLDLASMEPCHRYVEVIMSPTESDIERNLASNISSEYTFVGKQSGVSSEYTFVEKQSGVSCEEQTEHVDTASPVKSIEDAIVEVLTKKTVVEASVGAVKHIKPAEKPKPSTKPPSAAEKRKKTAPMRRGKKETPQYIELPPKDAFKLDVAEKRQPPSGKSPRTSPKLQPLEAQQQQEHSREPHGRWESIQRSLPSKRSLAKRSDSSGLPTDVDIAKLILVNMFQRKVEQNELLSENPFMEDRRSIRSAVSTVRDRTSPPQEDAVDKDHSLAGKDDLKPSSMLEKAASLKSEEKPPSSTKASSKVDKPITLKIKQETVAKKPPAKKEPVTVEVTIAVEQSKTIKIVHSKKKRDSIAPAKNQRESTQQLLEVLAARKSATKPIQSKPQQETEAIQSKTQQESVIVTPTPESEVAESSKKEDQLAKTDTSKKTSFADVWQELQKTDKVEHDEAQDVEAIEFDNTSAEALDGPARSSAKEMGESTKLIMPPFHVSPSNRRILTIVPSKTPPKSGAVTESDHRDSLEIPAFLGPEIPDEERRVSIYLKSDVHRVESATASSYMTETTDTTSTSGQTDATHVDYGEPEDVLFYEESSEQPTVHTRIYTKKSATSHNLPPIAPPVQGAVSVKGPTKCKTTFKKKMPETLQELLDRRKQLPTQTFVRDVNTGDLDQALVLTSATLKPQKEFKIHRDPIMLHTPESSTKCRIASSEDPKQSINQYLHSKGIHQMFRFLTTRLVIDRPEKPLDFLIEIVREIDKRRQFFVEMYTDCTGDSEKKLFA